MREPRAWCATLAALLVVAGGRGVEAQSVDLLRTEATDWFVRRDDGAGGDDARLTRVDHGLAVRTGASSILVPPQPRADGRYRIEVDFVAFDPQRRNEGYGVIFGGSGLDGEEQAYGYVLIRQDGMLLVKTRRGADTRVVRDWSRLPAVRAWADRPAGADAVMNSLGIEVAEDGVTVLVNGVPAGTWTDAGLPRAGLVGLRVNHGLSIRVDRLVVAQSGESPSAATSASNRGLPTRTAKQGSPGT